MDGVHSPFVFFYVNHLMNVQVIDLSQAFEDLVLFCLCLLCAIFIIIKSSLHLFIMFGNYLQEKVIEVRYNVHWFVHLFVSVYLYPARQELLPICFSCQKPYVTNRLIEGQQIRQIREDHVAINRFFRVLVGCLNVLGWRCSFCISLYFNAGTIFFTCCWKHAALIQKTLQ